MTQAVGVDPEFPVLVLFLKRRKRDLKGRDIPYRVVLEFLGSFIRSKGVLYGRYEGNGHKEFWISHTDATRFALPESHYQVGYERVD